MNSLNRAENVVDLPGADESQQSPDSSHLLTEVPKPPSHLNRYGKAKWRELLQILVDERRAYASDLTLLEIMCENYGIYREAQAAIHCKVPDVDELGYKIPGKTHKRTLAEYLDGRNCQTTPELTAMNRAHDKFHTMAKEFGLSPMGRKRAGQKEKPADDNPVKAYIRAMNDRLERGKR